jgi:hypothetical protein
MKLRRRVIWRYSTLRSFRLHRLGRNPEDRISNDSILMKKLDVFMLGIIGYALPLCPVVVSILKDCLTGAIVDELPFSVSIHSVPVH